MPSFSATIRTASGKVMFSIFCTKVKTSPPALQPKQWKNWCTAFTENDAVFSWWKGHSPDQFCAPLLRSLTYSPTMRTMSACCLTVLAKSPGWAIGTSANQECPYPLRRWVHHGDTEDTEVLFLLDSPCSPCLRGKG